MCHWDGWLVGFQSCSPSDCLPEAFFCPARLLGAICFTLSHHFTFHMYINCLLVCQRQESYVYAGFDLVCRSSAKGSDAPGQPKSPLLWSWSLKLAQEVGGAEDMADGAGHQTEELKYDIFNYFHIISP